MTPTIVHNYYLAPAGCDTMLTQQIVSNMSISPLSSTAYCLGAFGAVPSSIFLANASFAKQAIEIPRSGILTRAWLKVGVAETGVLASAEPVAHALRFNDAVDVALPNLSYNARTQAAGADLNHVVAAGDLVALKITTPAWVTSPTLMGWYCVLCFR